MGAGYHQRAIRVLRLVETDMGDFYDTVLIRFDVNLLAMLGMYYDCTKLPSRLGRMLPVQ